MKQRQIRAGVFLAVFLALGTGSRAAGNRRASSMDPDGREPGSFGYWLRLSMAELQRSGFPVTMEEKDIRVSRVN
jgi:hypothetical protein